MQGVLSKYIPEERINIVPLWADTEFLKPIEKKGNIFIKKYRLQGKFLVIYSGNLGITHSIEVLVAIATAMKEKDIFFVIIGEGEKQQLVSSLIKKNQLDNCMLLPWQTIDMLPYSLSAADLSVVTLGKEASGLSIPSKIFSLMSVGSPVMCIADLESELVSLVNRCQIGACFLETEIEAMIAFIQAVKSNKDYHSQLQQNALTASKEFGPENAFKFVDV
jgi:glycosyltransferase involved in cell wall biosynthesis